MPLNKHFQEVQREISKKIKITERLKGVDQGKYVDSIKNIVMSDDSKELTKALKNLEKIWVRKTKYLSFLLNIILTKLKVS